MAIEIIEKNWYTDFRYDEKKIEMQTLPRR